MASIAEQLAQLAQLREQGVLTEDEFQVQKAAVLREQPEAAEVYATPKRSRGKGCLIGLVVAIVLVAILVAIAPKPSSAPVVPPSGAVDSTGTGGKVTMENFNRVRSGMQFDEVVAILGQPTQEMSRNEIAGTETVMYQWNGDSFGGNMNAMFQNNKLVQKAQFGLR